MNDLYLVCAQTDIQSDGSCLHPHWVTVPTLIPPLDIPSAVAISAAILGLWAVAYVWKSL
jgi:hypothetical protein